MKINEPRFLMSLIGIFLMLSIAGCKNPFMQEEPEMSQLSGLWQSQYVPRSQQEDYGFPAKMVFRLNEDGTASCHPFSIVGWKKQVSTINSTGIWYLEDANPSGSDSVLVKWEILIIYNDSNVGVRLSVKEKKGQLVLDYEWDPDLEAIIFVRVPE